MWGCSYARQRRAHDVRRASQRAVNSLGAIRASQRAANSLGAISTSQEAGAISGYNYF